MKIHEPYGMFIINMASLFIYNFADVRGFKNINEQTNFRASLINGTLIRRWPRLMAWGERI